LINFVRMMTEYGGIKNIKSIENLDSKNLMNIDELNEYAQEASKSQKASEKSINTESPPRLYLKSSFKNSPKAA